MKHIDDRRLLPDIASWIGLPTFAEDWSGVDVVFPLLEKMREEGAVVLLKLDGERTSNPYTAAVSGPILAENFTRTDASTLEGAIAHVIVHYARLRWEFPEDDFRKEL